MSGSASRGFLVGIFALFLSAISSVSNWIWRALVAILAVAAALATVMLAQMEIKKHGYERNKTSFDVMWRLEERTQVLKNATACIRFLPLIKTDDHWKKWRDAKPILLEDVDSHSKELFDRCVASNAPYKTKVDLVSTDSYRLNIHESDILELRSQVNGVLNAYDFALLPYKNSELGNKDLICENMAGYFWYGSRDGERKSTATKVFVEHVFRNIEEAHYSFPNLYFFLQEVKLGKCVKETDHIGGMLSSAYDKSIRMLRMVAVKLGLADAD